MHIAPFATETFFARYEFTTPHLLCASDCESLSVGELLALAGLEPAALADLPLNYTESQGDPALRAGVAATYETVEPEEVTILVPEEGIFLLMQSLLDSGDHVIVLTPAYDSLRNLAHHISGNVSEWAIESTATGWRLNLDRLADLVTDQTKLIIVNFPHNPTGLLPDQEAFEAILAIARQHGSWLFCDEMYRGLEFGAAARLPAAIDRYERGIVLSGLSKVHGLPGLRIGWLVIRDAELRGRLNNWKHYTTICSPAPSERLAIIALAAAGQLMARNQALVRRNVTLADDFFGRWPNLFQWRPPQAGSVALVGLNVPSAADYCHQLARQAGVLLLPGTALGAGDSFVRFGFGRTDFATNLAVYERYLAVGVD